MSATRTVVPKLRAPTVKATPPKTKPVVSKLPVKVNRPALKQQIRSAPSLGRQMTVNNAPRNTSDKWMSKHLPYLSSLRDPVHCPGVRIPDTSFSESSSFSLISHGNVTASASGVAGVIVGSPLSLLTTALVPQALITCTTNGGAVTGALGLASNPLIATVNQPFTESAVLNAGSIPIAPQGGNILSIYAASARVVSACLTLRSTNSLTAQSGYFVGASLPRQFLSNIGMSALNSLSVSSLQNFPNAITSPVNAPNGDNGITAFYSPTDVGSFSYASTGLASLSQTDPRAVAANPGALVCVVVGPASGTYLWDLCINYEVLLNNAAVGFGARPTFSDPVALAATMNERPNDALVSDGYNVWEDSGTMGSAEAGTYLGKTRSFSVDCSSKSYPVKTGMPVLCPDSFTRSLLITHQTPLRAKGGGGRGASRKTEYVEDSEVGAFESLAADVGRIADKLKMLLF